MADKNQATLNTLLQYYVSWEGYASRITLQERLLELEKSQYAYLPDASWMTKAGYISGELGTYLFAKYGEQGVVYKVRVLSQTSMVLLFREDYFLAGQLIESDEELAAFLQEHRFPAPACE
jgi:hypothetical protein